MTAAHRRNRPYAAKTAIAVDQTRKEIEALLEKHGADRTAIYKDQTKAAIVFELADRRISFSLNLPEPNDRGSDQHRRSLWRGLLLCIRAKLESVDAGIETFDEAFLAHVVTPDGSTVGEHVLSRLKQVASTGKMVPLLPGPSNG